MNSYVHGLFSAWRFCTQLLPNSADLRTPVHGTAGCGARQRRSPTGGAANGMPLKTEIDGSLPATPESRPVLIFTGCGTARARGSANRAQRTNAVGDISSENNP